MRDAQVGAYRGSETTSADVFGTMEAVAAAVLLAMTSGEDEL